MISRFILTLSVCLVGSSARAQFGLAVQTNGDLRVHTNFHGATIQMPTQTVVFTATPRVGTNAIATLHDIVAGTVTNDQWMGDLVNYLPLAGGTVTNQTTFYFPQTFTNLGGHKIEVIAPADGFQSPALRFTIDEGDTYITDRLSLSDNGRLQSDDGALALVDEVALLSGATMTGALQAPAIQIGSVTLAYTGGAFRTTGVWQHYDAFDSYAMRRIFKVNDVGASSSWGNLIEQYYIFGESAANHHWAMGVASNWAQPGYASWDGIRFSPDLTYSNFVLQLARDGQILAGPGGSFVGAFTGNGGGLTNIPGSAIVGGVGSGSSLPFSEMRWGRRWEGSINGGFIYTMAAGADDISSDTTTNLDLFQCFFLCAVTTYQTNTMYGHFYPPATNASIALKFRANQPQGTIVFTATDGQTAVSSTQNIAAAFTTYRTNMLLTGTAVTNWKMTVIQATTNVGNQYRMGVGQ